MNRQAYRRYLVPLELIELARASALSALVEFDSGQPTERMTSFAFVADVVPPN